MLDHIRHVGQHILDSKAREAHLKLRTEGVAFSGCSSRGEDVQDAWPFDIVPRIITADEWRTIEAGLVQRVRALNLFLQDIYDRQNILKDGAIPPELIYNGKRFRREIMDICPPHDVYASVSCVDLIRDEEGSYLVLKDNLHMPSGMSYMIENRIVQRCILPELFTRYRVKQVDHFPKVLLRALRQVSPRGAECATIVVLTPGAPDSTYFEHAFLAGKMGVELAEGKNLTCKSDKVYLKTRRGLRQVDVVYRRIDDDFLDPLAFKQESEVGVAGIVNAWRAGNVAIVNAPGAGIADDKAVYAHVPAIIRYYLGETPLLSNVPTFEMTDPQDQDFVLDNLAVMVVKAAAESGSRGMLVGPVSTPSQRADFARRIRENPRDYVAQPVVQLSRHLCYLEGELESRHLDLRPFVICGRDIEVVPGGLTRVAMRKGSMVVSPAQGGGSKDTWVLAD
jgi:uncharacterized circularly permuted ATP-grasp superfamily protein